MRLIDADELKEAFEKIQYTEEFCIAHQIDYSISMHMAIMTIDNAPTVPLPDFKEGYKQAIIDGKTNFSRPQGEWIFNKEMSITCSLWNCSVCNRLNPNDSFNFCPNYGADMRGEEE